MRRTVGALVLAAVLAVGCSSGDPTVTVQAKFTDVIDLAERAPVFFADIRVGKVTDIRLAGTQALVTMEIEESADVPSGVTARIRRTSVLGERIIDLVVPAGLPTSADSLSDGETIDDTLVRSDLENLVVEGVDVFSVIGASEIATMVDEGAKGFGGKGEELGELIRNLDTITNRYSRETDTIRSLIDNINVLNTTVAPHVGAHKKALANTEKSLRLLNEESAELQRALHELARLATGSRSILDEHVDEMDHFFTQMQIITTALENQQASIRQLLKWAPGHNRNTQLVEYQEFNQVIQEFVFCGFNDDPNDPARRCIESGSS